MGRSALRANRLAARLLADVSSRVLASRLAVGLLAVGLVGLLVV